MLDLGAQTTIPRYELKLKDGTTKSYDSLLLGYKLQDFEGEVDPEKIMEVINKLFDVDVDALAAIQILEDFTAFSIDHLEEPLKKVFGRELSSTTTTDSRPESSES